jgi:hypothetical protein
MDSHSKPLLTMGHGNNFEQMYGCVIMHKMIIDNECDDNLKALFDIGIGPQLKKGFTFTTYKQGIKEIET